MLKTAISRDDEHEVTVEAGKTARWLSIRRTALHLEPSTEGRLGPDQYILILRDITARKEAEQQRETSRNMLALGEMAAVLAHEIRNPLGSMELWTSVLEKQAAHWRRRENIVLSIYRRACARSPRRSTMFCSFMVTDRPITSRCKLKTVLQNGISFIRPLAEQAGVKLTVNVEIDNVEIEGRCQRLAAGDSESCNQRLPAYPAGRFVDDLGPSARRHL